MGKMLNPDPFNPRLVGLSPLGNNSVEQQANPGDAPIDPTDTAPREVPLVYDPITGTYCTPLDKVNQEERLAGIEVARLTNEDQRFLSAAGFVPGPNIPSTTQI
jgi:allophanate hydrolase subunit 1